MTHRNLIGTVPKLVLAGALGVVAVALFIGPLSDQIENLNGARISGWVNGAGAWGPILVIALMALAIVASPIPSAPIALAAGAAYGHTIGTIYIAVGAEIGAMVAFTLARYLGRDVLTRWFGDKVDKGWLGSQNALTVTVFASRLMPFISFDIVSYAAGLSCLHFWRFAVATLAGIIPASFVLAHFGNEAVSGETGRAAWAAIGLGALTLTPLVIVAIRERLGKRAAHD
ncbi:TVP38/TMEM64 family protein [Roseovarius pelagicus]|uniref:TVP38/TMEM64 family membrane protein n=1 Tax=Roseovarius pelagicus TaxID=2980108 RepID=A0ABY6DGF9_9RHOB|nr:VTT domain-containing protein [Roseovarius pelagicus]UXX85256.1 VTT domain-containing protein [Roseovarius pelagicus]